ncbi:thioredoxin-like protein [Dichotomocladium elegans]|nr:thioredoxin-like protein [Dichotomocladium elegans]
MDFFCAAAASLPLSLFQLIQTTLMRLLWAWLAVIAAYTIDAATIPELSSTNFADTIREGTWFVEFYSPYCHHCQAFAPTWQQLADENEALAETHHFHFAKVDCTLNGDLCKEQSILAFPSLRLYVQGEFTEMFPAAQRTYENLKDYIARQAVIADSRTSKEEVANGEDEEDEKTQVDAEQMANPEGISIDLDRAALAAAKASGQPWFVKFYAPWCGFCKKLAPAWVEMAKDLKHQVNVGEVNCDMQRDVCTKNGVTGFPTLKLFANGEEHLYNDDRSLVSLVNFARKLTGPSIHHVNAAHLDRYLQQDAVALVYLYENKMDDATTLLSRVARRFPDGPTFYVTSDPNAIRRFSLSPTDLPTVLIVKDNKHIMYPSHDFTHTEDVEQALEGWINDERFPLVSEIGPGNAEEILGGDRVVVLGIIKREDQTNTANFRSLAAQYQKQQKASSQRSNVLFATLDANMWIDYARQTFAIHPNRLPAVVIVDPADATYYNANGAGIKFALDSDPSVIINALTVEMPGKKLVGVSMLPFHSRVGQAVQHGFGVMRAHWLLTSIAVSGLVYMFIKRMRSGGRSAHRRSAVLPIKQGLQD